MKVQKNISVHLVKKRNIPIVRVVQFDTGVQLVFNMKDFEIPNGTTATLYVQKPSGNFVYQDSGITVTSDSIVVDLWNQAIVERGEAGYQVRLKNGNDLLSTFSGILEVEKSLADSGAVESETVASAFDKKMADMLASTIRATHDGTGNVTLTIG